MPILYASDFKPAWWLPGCHAQTLWPALCRAAPKIHRVRETVPTADGDFLALDWHGSGGGPVVVLLHGLSGSAASKYIGGMQAVLAKLGWRSVALNFRGCSGEPNWTARCYHSGDTYDFGQIIALLRQRLPSVPVAAVGFSLGGNVLLKWLGETGAAAGLFAAVAVSVPLRLDICADRMDVGFSRLYRESLLRELEQYLSDKRRHLRNTGRIAEAEKLEALGDLRGIHSFWEYDARIVAKLYGFRDAADFYQKSSSRQFLKAIQTPTLVIQAEDDPFMTPAALPGNAELSQQVTLEISPCGGHVGFIAGDVPGKPEYWLERRIPRFLQERLSAPL